MWFLTLVKYVRIGAAIFNLTSDALEIANRKDLSKKEKGIEILKAIPDEVLEKGLTTK